MASYNELSPEVLYQEVMNKVENFWRFLDHINNSKKPTIAAFGIYNAGKSYLLNVLTNHLNEGTFPFKVRDVRETAETKDLEYNNIIYRDTPGLDAKLSDDVEAKNSVIDCDIILFVHGNPLELDQIELDELRALKSYLGDSVKDSLIMVQNKIDIFVDNPEGLTKVTNRVSEQCEALFGTKIPLIPVSAKRYLSGHAKNKDVLIQKSGIPDLINLIEDRVINNFALRKKRVLNRSNQLIEDLDLLANKIRCGKSKTLDELQPYFSEFINATEKYQQGLYSYKDKFKRLSEN